MRSKHHDGKVQGDFLPQYSKSLIAQACGTAALSYSSKENGDGWISYTGIWGFVSHRCDLASCWVCCARTLGHLTVRRKRIVCSSSSLEMQVMGFPQMLSIYKLTEMHWQEGNTRQCLEADGFLSPLLSSRRHCRVTCTLCYNPALCAWTLITT